MAIDPPVRSDVRDGVGTLTLDDGAHRNILDDAMIDAIRRGMDELEADERVRAIVVTGAGPAFCAGAPLSVLEESAAGDFAAAHRIYSAFIRVWECALPTVAAVNGPALGAGMNLALVCDMRIGGRSAWFQSRYARMHLHPGGGHLWLLERAGGSQLAAAAAFDLRLQGQDAVRAGILWDLVEDEELADATHALAARAGALDPAYARSVKQSLRMPWTGKNFADAIRIEEDLQRASMARPAFLDAIAALRTQVERSRS